MRLRDLEATFVRIERGISTRERIIGDPETWRERGCPTEEYQREVDYIIPVDSLAEAQGVKFLCPKCFEANGGRVGTHGVVCWFRHRGVPEDANPKPGRWTPEGTGLDDLTFVPGDPPVAKSVLLPGEGCGWHGFVENGNAS